MRALDVQIVQPLLNQKSKVPQLKDIRNKLSWYASKIFAEN